LGSGDGDTVGVMGARLRVARHDTARHGTTRHAGMSAALLRLLAVLMCHPP
jgi:hypothetical protein